MKIGNEIKTRRNELNLTQEDLAKKLNVSRTAVSNWEQQRNYPDIELLVTISDELDISLDKLLRGDSKMVKELSFDYKKKKKYKVIILISTIIILILSFLIIYIWTNQPTVFNSTDLVIENIKKVEIPEQTIDGKTFKKDYKYIIKVRSKAKFKTFSITDSSGNIYKENDKVYVTFQAKNTLNLFSDKVSELVISNFSRQSDLENPDNLNLYNIDKDIYIMGNSKKDTKLILSKDKNQ